MTEVPIRIYTYLSSDTALPADRRAIARIQMQMLGGLGKKKGVGLVWDYSPVIIYAETEEAARIKAQDWFDEQVALERQKQENTEKRVAAMKARREAAQ